MHSGHEPRLFWACSFPDNEDDATLGDKVSPRFFAETEGMLMESRLFCAGVALLRFIPAALVLK